MSWMDTLMSIDNVEPAPGADLTEWSGRLAQDQAKNQRNELFEEGIGLPGSVGLISKVAGKAIDTIKTAKNLYSGVNRIGNDGKIITEGEDNAPKVFDEFDPAKGEGSNLAENIAIRAKSAVQDAVARGQSTVEDAVSRGQSTVENLARPSGLGQSAVEDLAARGQSMAEDLAARGQGLAENLARPEGLGQAMADQGLDEVAQARGLVQGAGRIGSNPIRSLLQVGRRPATEVDESESVLGKMAGRDALPEHSLDYEETPAGRIIEPGSGEPGDEFANLGRPGANVEMKNFAAGGEEAAEEGVGEAAGEVGGEVAGEAASGAASGVLETIGGALDSTGIGAIAGAVLGLAGLGVTLAELFKGHHTPAPPAAPNIISAPQFHVA